MKLTSTNPAFHRSTPAFLTPLPFAPSHHSALLHSPSTIPVIRRSQRPAPCLSMNSGQHQFRTPLWRRVLAITTLSASMIFTPLRPERHNDGIGLQFSTPTALAAPTTRTATSTTNASDVEAAVLTLGVVTAGGLIMRAIVRSRQNDDQYKQTVLENSKKLQHEEDMRALRVKRSKMEAVDDDDEVEDDDTFMQEFRKRVSGLKNENESEENPDDADRNKYEKQELDLLNKADRGTSAVLDKPDSTSDKGSSESDIRDETPSNADEDESDSVPPSMANPDQAEMLKRMWNLNSFDKKD